MEQKEYSSSSTYSQKMLHFIYYSFILPLPIPENYRKEYSLKVKHINFKNLKDMIKFMAHSGIWGHLEKWK